MTRRAPDQPIREQALDPRGSWLVTAPAGSGKTALLAARFLRLLAEGGPDGRRCHPRRILALTFTDKAAAEMRERISLWLSRAAEPGYEPGEAEWDRTLLTLARAALEAFRDEPELLSNPTAYRVGTFHGLCAAISSRWPAQAEVPPGVGILPDERQEAALAVAVRQALDEAAERPPVDELRAAMERRLAALNGNAQDLSAKLAALLKDRHRLGEAWGFLQRGDLEGAEAAVARRLGEYLAIKLRPAADYFRSRPQQWRALHEALAGGETEGGQSVPAEVPGTSPEELPGWVRTASAFLTGGSVRKVFGTRSGFPRNFPKECGDFIRSTPAEAATSLAFLQKMSLDPQDPAGLAALFDFLALAAAALEKLSLLIPGRGLDYLELEMAALRALSRFDRPSESLVFFHETVRHILVDEAQDLNPEQARLLGRLLEGWEPGESAHPRTLFVVGDPKQSIYRFRRSEVSLFKRMEEGGVEREGEEPFTFQSAGGVLRLTANFRSQPALVRFCNGLFEQVLGREPSEDLDEVAFGESEAGLEAAPEAPAIRLALFPKNVEGASEDARTAEARWLASEADRLRRERPGESVAILLARRSALAAFVAAFSEIGLPVRMVEGQSLAARPEVLYPTPCSGRWPCPTTTWPGPECSGRRGAGFPSVSCRRWRRRAGRTAAGPRSRREGGAAPSSRARFPRWRPSGWPCPPRCRTRAVRVGTRP